MSFSIDTCLVFICDKYLSNLTMTKEKEKEKKGITEF